MTAQLFSSLALASEHNKGMHWRCWQTLHVYKQGYIVHQCPLLQPLGVRDSRLTAFESCLASIVLVLV